jgi:hypothetical protein
MKLKMISLLFSLIALLNLSCNTTEPPLNNNTISLTVEDVSCTEAWLSLTADKTSNEIVIKQNEQEVKRFTPNSLDTLIVIDSLLPNQNYYFQAFDVSNNQTISASEKIVTKTMDTTSHNFTWQTFTFGDIGNSVLFDVEIINEQNIWCVGEINIADTSELGYTTYNAVHWDGISWELKKIIVDYKGNTTIAPLKSVFVLSDGNIILSSGLPYLPDGLGGWKLYHLWDMEFCSRMTEE